MMILYSNYRPISVVPILAKVLEKIVSVQFIQYLEMNNLLHPHQGAFRCGKSTEDILLLTVDHIFNSYFECRQVSMCCFFGFEKSV